MEQRHTVFLFDLDGTLTRTESLPYIAEHFGLWPTILEETHRAVQGDIPYEESLRRRLDILATCPREEVIALLRRIPMHQQLLAWVQRHSAQSAIVTSNLDLWWSPILTDLGLAHHCSEASVASDGSIRLRRILNKGSVVQQMALQGYRTIYIGDGANDYQAMQVADVGIAVGLTHSPAHCLRAVSQYIETEENSLCALLDSLAGDGGI